MARRLMKFEVKSELELAADTIRTPFKHPSGSYEIHLENASSQMVGSESKLIAYVIFEAPDIDSAPEIGEKVLRDFLDIVVLMTGSALRIHKKVCLFDWAENIVERHGRIYKVVTDPDSPLAQLDSVLAKSVQTYIASNPDEFVLRALRWYSAGVSAGPADEQFQFFWHSIETLSKLEKEHKEVSDTCARCGEPLYCKQCKAVSIHMPYPSQAIKQLFEKTLPEQPDAYTHASAMRYALLHGDNTDVLATRLGVNLSDLVDVCAEVAWRVLVRVVAPKDQDVKVALLKPNTVLHHELITQGHVSFKSPEGREVKFEDIPDINMDVIIGKH